MNLFQKKFGFPQQLLFLSVPRRASICVHMDDRGSIRSSCNRGITFVAHDGIATHSIPDRAGDHACLLACGYIASDGLHARKCRATFSGLARRELREARSPSYSRASGVTLCSRHHKVPRGAEHEFGQTYMHGLQKTTRPHQCSADSCC